MKYFKYDTIHNIIIYTVIWFLIFALITEFFLQRWMLFFVTFLALILTILSIYTQYRLNISLSPDITLTIVIFIVASIYLGEVHGFYDKFVWWDALLHTLSGFILGTIGFGFLYILYKNSSLIAKPFLIVFLSFCFAMTMGVLWEVFEYAVDVVFDTNMQRRETGINDTMQDFIANIIGASIACLGGYTHLKKGKSRVFKRLVEKFELANQRLFIKK